jgi:SAM-dependent methyltransferase
VIAAHMLYHVPDPVAAVRELARVLAPEGHALVVLNGAHHMQAIRDLLVGALHDLIGDEPSLPARSMERITVEDAPAVLAAGFGGVRVERVSRAVEVPDAQPVVDYANSTQHFYAPFLPDDVGWSALMARVSARVDATIATDGRWCARSDVGCFVCAEPRQP